MIPQWVLLRRASLLCGDGDAFPKKRKYDFGGISTPDLYCSFMTGKTLSCLACADWHLRPEHL